MSDRKKYKSLAQWKERARQYLHQVADEVARRQGVNPEEIKRRKRSDSEFLKRAVLVTDPVKVSLKDSFGGTFTCTYDIGQTLMGLSQGFQKMEAADSEIEEFAKTANITLDEAMARIAFRYVEAEIFSRLKAGRFLHEQLKPALEQMLGELLDDVYLHSIREYGYELDEPAKTLEKVGRAHIKHRKKRSGLVRAPGHPQTWAKEELLAKVNEIISTQREMPTLARIARAMNYGGLRGGASALGKLLKRHSIAWKELRSGWQKTRKRT